LKKLLDILADPETVNIDDTLERMISTVTKIPETVEELEELILIAQHGTGGKITKLKITNVAADVKKAKSYIDPKAFIYI